MSSVPFSFTERPRPNTYWALCGSKDTGHATVVLYQKQNSTYFLFIGQESVWLKDGTGDKWKPTDLPIESNPFIQSQPYSHVVTRHCERVKNTPSGVKGTLSEGYTIQYPSKTSTWGFPKGGSIRSETPEQTAEREVWEETDFRVESARLADGKQTPRFSYRVGAGTGTGFLYELTSAESRELLCSYAILNLRREGELFHGRLVSASDIYRVYYPQMNAVSKQAFDAFCLQKGINKSTLGGYRQTRRRKRTLRRRKTG